MSDTTFNHDPKRLTLVSSSCPRRGVPLESGASPRADDECRCDMGERTAARQLCLWTSRRITLIYEPDLPYTFFDRLSYRCCQHGCMRSQDGKYGYDEDANLMLVELRVREEGWLF